MTRIFHQLIPANYNAAVVRRANTEPLLRPFKSSGTLRERGATKWFPVEFLMYHDERNKLRSFAYVRREDGVEIPDGQLRASFEPWLREDAGRTGQVVCSRRY